MKRLILSLFIAGLCTAPASEVAYNIKTKPKSELYELVPAPIVEYSVGQVYLVDDKMLLNEKSLHCLAKNIYFEAAHRQLSRLSIAQVTMNRVESGKWGDDVCTVVLAKRQFSWTHLTDHKVSDRTRWQASVSAAKAYLNGARVKGLESVMYYHADYIPLRVWAKKMKIVLKDGGHLFFAS